MIHYAATYKSRYFRVTGVLVKELTWKLGNKVIFALTVIKINDRTIFKDGNKITR